jgi:hypothetical protein
MSETPEALYFQLGQLIKEMPSFTAWPVSDEENHWLARAFSLLELTQVTVDASLFKQAVTDVNSPHRNVKDDGLTQVKLILFRALHRTERKVPVGLQGAFLGVGDAFEALMAVGKILGSATSDILIIDPYADAKILDDYARQCPVGVSLRVMADERDHKPSLGAAARAWMRQFKTLRPLDVRLANAGSLHDRLIIVDKKMAYDLTQSFNALATRSPATISRANLETAYLKTAYYESLWQSAQPLQP